MVKIINLVCLILVQIQALGFQLSGEYPEIGKEFPKFGLNDVQYDVYSKVGPEELKGKWSILYFWNQYCGSCVEGFPKLNTWQERYGKSLKFLLVGYTGSQYSRRPNDKSIRALYERERVGKGLDLSIAYDSILFHRFGIHSCPYIVIIDSVGVVRGITSSLIASDIEKVSRGVIPKLPKVWRKDENKITYDPDVPLFVNNNGGKQDDFVYRSVFSIWKEYMPLESSYKINRNTIQVSGVDLSSLYRFAYWGTALDNFDDSLYTSSCPWPILHVKDTGRFRPDYRLMENLYACSLTLPVAKANKAGFMDALRNELRNAFGYSVKIEKMAIQCLLLKKVIVGRGRTGIPKSSKPTIYSLSKDLLREIYESNRDKRLMFLDGLEGQKQAITLDCDLGDLTEVRKQLVGQGFDLVPVKKMMNVMVISDGND